MSRLGSRIVIATMAIALCGPLAVAAASGEPAPVERCQVVDLPDPAYGDANCDGIDGQINAARFVSPSGADANPCTLAAPCRTIQRAVNRAVALGKRDVYVAGGTYAAFRVASGVNVFGGFGRNFQRAPARATGSRTATVSGALALPGGLKVTVLTDDLGRRATLADLTLRGADATAPGTSSYVIAGHSSTLQLTRLRIIAGDGASGADGSDGADATSLAAPATAVAGGDSLEATVACNSQSHGAGGPGGSNAAAAPSRAMGGGAGGAGGEMDTDCALTSFDYTATVGDAGGPGAFDPAGLPGDGGGGGAGAASCGDGLDGQPGVVANGAAGQGAPSGGGRVLGDYWGPLPGSDGTTGENGSGGGGGGGSGGCDTGLDAYGAGGGGGGAGGAAALGGGGAGHGGGGSFGVFLVDSVVTVSKLTIERGTGGTGGDGGDGGRGQQGGLGGVGGTGDGAGVGGTGGRGAHGGHGGGGASGAGGASAAILTLGSTLTVGNGVTVLGGLAGGGGTGGTSAPTATGADDDGNDGGAGPAGPLWSVETCALASAC